MSMSASNMGFSWQRRKEKTMPFGVILMRSQVLYRAAQAHKHIAKYHKVAQLRYVQHVQIVCSADSVKNICSAAKGHTYLVMHLQASQQ